MNKNRITTNDWSNETSKMIYFANWQNEQQVKALYENGRQCGGCSFFAPLNSDWGLCCHNDSLHFSETIFEHFTCSKHTNEGWGPHSFTESQEFHCWCEGEPKRGSE